MENAMQERGLKMSEFVAQFNLEVLNRGADFDTMLLTITDVNRPGLSSTIFMITSIPAVSR